MKAKVKETGEIVDVEPYFYAKINSTDPMIHKNDIELIKPNADIDWEQRRYEIAKNVMCSAEGAPKMMADYAVSCADALIEKLKKRK